MAAPIGNQYALGNKGGRPAHYENEADLIAAIDNYFIYIEGETKQVQHEPDKDHPSAWFSDEWVRFPEPATVTGLALYLGFCSKSSLFDYETKEEFSTIIKKARTRVEHEYEKRLHSDKNVGAIFALKNMGWKDKTETEVIGGMNFTWNEIKNYGAESETDESH